MLSQKMNLTALLFGIIKAVKEESNILKAPRVLVDSMYLFTSLSILKRNKRKRNRG